jgi:hypothetical protein
VGANCAIWLRAQLSRAKGTNVRHTSHEISKLAMHCDPPGDIIEKSGAFRTMECVLQITDRDKDFENLILARFGDSHGTD